VQQQTTTNACLFKDLTEQVPNFNPSNLTRLQSNTVKQSQAESLLTVDNGCALSLPKVPIANGSTHSAVDARRAPAA